MYIGLIELSTSAAVMEVFAFGGADPSEASIFDRLQNH